MKKKWYITLKPKGIKKETSVFNFLKQIKRHEITMTLFYIIVIDSSTFTVPHSKYKQNKKNIYHRSRKRTDCVLKKAIRTRRPPATES